MGFTWAAAFAGADAVVHLAWVIQPNHDREFLRRVNVLGTERVLAAARAAAVPHVVVASSVGAYSASSKDALRGETWPTEGIASSEYSVDKAAVESLLDAHVRDHPEVLITRLRPALIFQRAAASEIIRYFVGAAAPTFAFRGNLPAMPWPEGTRVQALHADDAGYGDKVLAEHARLQAVAAGKAPPLTSPQPVRTVAPAPAKADEAPAV